MLHIRPLLRSSPAPVALGVFLLALPSPARAQGRPLEDLRELDRQLAMLAAKGERGTGARNRIETHRGPRGGRSAFAELSARLERRHALKRREFERGAARALPPKAAERLARARAAYEAGQGRLLDLLRQIGGGAPGPELDHGIAEARALLEKIEEASRPQPSSDDLKVRVPMLQAPPAFQGSGTVTDTDAALGPVPPALKEAAATLGGPVEVYEWVRNHVRPEFYYGAMKGPVQTYLERGGNDVDTASLLVELLRAKGVPARYVRGWVELPARRLQALTGTAALEPARRVLERAGVPHQAVAGVAGLASVKVERTWVEAYVPYANYRGTLLDSQGKLWVPLDPGLKEIEPPRGLDVVRELGFDPRLALDQYLDSPPSATPLEFARGRVTALLASRGLGYADALNSRGFLPENLGLLPGSLPYKVAGPTDVSYDIPSTLRHTVRFLGEANGAVILDATFPVADLLGRRLTLAYVPFDDEDARTVRLHGGLPRTPPYLIEVRPVLRSAGITIAGGGLAIGAGVKYALRVEIQSPGGVQAIINTVLAGNLTAIGLGGSRVTAAEPGADRAAEILAGIGWSYLQRWNRSDEELADLLRVVPVRPTASACFVMSAIDVEYAGGNPLYPVTFDWKGIAIDADLRSSAPVGLASGESERSFLLLSGLEGSILENRVFEEGLGIESVSTAKALQLARAAGIAVLDITRDDVDSVLPGLPIDPVAKEEIEAAARRGLLARVPASPLSHLAWTGVGYMLLDEETGEAAYQLQGGHSGGVTAPAVIDIPASIKDPVAQQGEDPTPEDSSVAHIAKFVSTDFQDGTVDKPLAKPFKVLVTDAEGFAVPRAPVAFSLIGGGGTLADPITGRPSEGEIIVLSNDKGEAEATLILGARTDLIPRFVCPEEGCSEEHDRHATQVGLNQVAARSGAVALVEPFTAFGYPDDQFDGQFRYAFLWGISTLANAWEWPNLRYAERLGAWVTDQHFNPMSNAEIVFAYRPEPVPFLPPPTVARHRPPNTSPAQLVTPFQYNECIKAHPAPLWGECPNHAPRVSVKSSIYGAFAYAALGDCPACGYWFDYGTVLEPTSASVRSPTNGWGCLAGGISPLACDSPRDIKAPVVLMLQRQPRTNLLGNMVEGYPPGGEGEVELFAEAYSEKERVFPTQTPDGLQWVAEGTNQWRRERLTDSTFRLDPATSGTQASSGAAHAGNGRYVARMTMGQTPQLNKVAIGGEHYPLAIPYLPGTRYVDPTYVTAGPDPTVLRQRTGPVVVNSEFSLWGVEAEIKAVDPAPVLLDSTGAVTRTSKVQHEIRPQEYRRLLLVSTDVRFDLSRGDQVIAQANGVDGEDFVIPSGLAFPPGDYTARVSVLGVTGQGKDVASDPFPVTACQLLSLASDQVVVKLTVDPLNEFVCGDQGEISFTLCRNAKVTVTVKNQVLKASIDGGPPQSIDSVSLAAGVHVVALPPKTLGDAPDEREPFLVRAVDAADPTLVVEAPGDIMSVLRNRAVLPVGRTFVKGVDLFDGHVVQQATDIKVPGRHLGLDVTRTYSSAGHSPQGALGAGWSFSYTSQLNRGDCGLVTVTTADGSSQVFRTTDGGVTFTAQKGYHTRLVRNDDDSYDFFDKSATRHHFREPEDAVHPFGDRRLEYIEEPHGDRIVVTYDAQGRVSRVGEMHPEAGVGEVRSLEVSWTRVKGFDRVARIASAALGLEVDYKYDALGNLSEVTRSGQNLPGGPDGEPRVHKYEYYVDTPPFAPGRPDRHQLKVAVDPNGNRVEYRYYTEADRFPGEVFGPAGALVVLNKGEYAKEVVEFPAQGRSQPQLVTRFQYDVSEVLQLRWRTTVRDARGFETLYVLNGHGSPLEVHEPLGKTTFREWATTDIFKTRETEPRTETYPQGRVTDYGYDDRANLTSERITTPDFGVVETTYEYDPKFNKLTFKRDAEGRETRYEIDPQTGDLLKMTDAVGNVTQYAYDSHGQLTTVTDPRGHSTSHSDHDTFGKPHRITDPESNVTTREYDFRGRLTLQSDTLGRETRTVFDGLDRPLELTRVAGGTSDDEITKTEYFAGGEVKAVTNTNGARTEYTRDGLNRVVATSTPLGTETLSTVTEYDGNGNKVSETDRRGVKRRSTFDALNRLMKVEIVSGLPGEGPSGQVAAYGYDLVGNKTSETNLAGLTTRFAYDGLYRVKEKELPEGPSPDVRYKEIYSYDKVDNRLSVKDANGNETTFAYDGLNRLLLTTNALNQTTTITYQDPEGSRVNKAEEHDQTRGLRTTYLYDKLNREVERKVHLEGEDGDPAPGPVYTTSTAYDDSAHSMTVTDPRDTATRTVMNGLNRVVEQTVDPSGLSLTTLSVHDGLGNRREVRDPNGNLTRFRYDGLGRLVETTDALNHEASYTYDGEGLKISETDRRNVARTFAYDNLGRLRKTVLVASISSVAWSQETQYQDVARKRIETDARGNATTYELDGLERVVKVTDATPLRSTILARWDGVNKREETDKRGNTTKYDYDAFNRLTRMTDPEPFPLQTVQTLYEDGANRRTETDRRGIVKATQMDPLGRVISVTRASGRPDEAVLETNSYDGNGNKVSAKDAEGKETHFAYDAANRLRERTDGFGSAAAATTRFRYDNNGNQVEELDQRAAELGEPFSLRRSYDELNRLKSVRDGEGNLTEYDYDPEGNRTLVKEPQGQETTFDYDELGKLTKVIQPAPAPGEPQPVIRYDYDPNRNRTKQTDANNHVVEMTYDELNRLDKMTQRGAPEGDLVTDHDYDQNGNEITLKDPKGQTVTSTYDELDRLKTKSYAFAPSDPVRPWRHTTGVVYSYDPNNNLIQVDESVASGTDPPEVLTTTRAYDDLDRLTSETTTLPDSPTTGARTRTVGYSYFRNGTRKTVTDPASLTTSYSYDGQNRLETATTVAGTTIYSYFPDDLLKTVTYPNGLVATHGYDKGDRPVSLLNGRDVQPPASFYAYEYDRNGNRLKQVETNGGTTETTTYSYDDLNRLKSVTYPADASFPQGRTVDYGYDLVGNRTSETATNAATGAPIESKAASFDSINRLERVTHSDPNQTVAFDYDRNGNQTKKTVGPGSPVVTEYRYDVRDKLVEAGQGGSILGRFQYDFEARRTLKVGEGLPGDTVRQYVYDQTSLLLEYADDGGQVAKYEYGSDRLISLFRRDEPRRYFSLDGLRSVVNLTDDSGTVAASYHLDAWGNFRFPTELNPSANRFAFTGYYFDKETGLYNAKARYFDPRLGRFLSQDSFLGQIDNPPSLHRYFYANANPLRFVDPTGHQAEGIGSDVKERILEEAKAPFENPELAAAREEANRARADAAHVVREDNWLDKVGRNARIAGQAAAAMRADLWAWLTGHVADNAEAVGKAAIKQRPPSETTRTKQAVAEALAESDPSGAARDVARKADVAEGARQAAGEISRAAGEGAVIITQAVVESELPGKAIGILSKGRRANQIARSADDAIDAQRAESRIIARESAAAREAAAAEAVAAKRSSSGTSSTYSVGRTHLSEAELGELRSRPDIRVTGTTGAGAARPPRHHIFIQEKRAWFKERGVDIDKYTLELTQGEHTAAHTMGWNERVKEFVADEALLGRPYTRREIMKFGAELRREFGFGSVKAGPFDR